MPPRRIVMACRRPDSMSCGSVMVMPDQDALCELRDVAFHAARANNFPPIAPAQRLDSNHPARADNSAHCAGARPRFWPLQDIVFTFEFMGVPAACRTVLLLTRLALDGALADRTLKLAFAGCESAHAATPVASPRRFLQRRLHSHVSANCRLRMSEARWRFLDSSTPDYPCRSVAV
jgi:hypothetical protein